MNELFDASRRFLLSRRGAILAAAGVGAGMALLWFRVTGPGQTPAASVSDLMAAELLQAAKRADMCTGANAVGVGLRGEYFAEPDLQGPLVLVRVDDVVDFDASIRQPAAAEAGARKVSSVRWTGWIKSPISGHYRFHADAPGMRVLVARNLVAGVDASPAARVEMAAGRFYPVEVVASQITDSPARIRLEWTAPHGARYVVPRALLQLPTDTVVAANANINASADANSARP